VLEQISILARVHPSWRLVDVKSLTIRERRYWMDLARYEAERRSMPQ
jgi:hypothetical protein